MGRQYGAVVAAAAVLLAGCSSDTAPESTISGRERSAKRYASVQELARDAPYVLRGTITGIRDRRIDDGGNPAGGGIPMTFYTMAVDSYLKAAGPKDTTIVVAWAADPDLGATPLVVNEKYIIFAERLTADQVPGVADLAPMFSPLSGDAGVLDVRGAAVTSHGGAVPAMSTDAAVGWTVAAVEAVVGG